MTRSVLNQRLLDQANEIGRSFNRVDARILGPLNTVEQTNLATAINEVAAIATHIAVGTSPPANPAVGDLWVDTN